MPVQRHDVLITIYVETEFSGYRYLGTSTHVPHAQNASHAATFAKCQRLITPDSVICTHPLDLVYCPVKETPCVE